MNNPTKILVIEDDRYISGFLTMSLRKEGYDVASSDTGTQGLFLISMERPDILLLDLGLPDRDGLSVLKEIRQNAQLPVIVVSARGQEKEKIAALDAGADDYVTKPFYLGELLARIRVAERKLAQKPVQETDGFFHQGELGVDFEKRKVLIEGNEIHLTPMEYKLLALLIQNRGKVLTHNFILGKVWGYEEGGDTKTVRVFMASLRRKIEKDTMKPRFILTEIGVGYRFAEE